MSVFGAPTRLATCLALSCLASAAARGQDVRPAERTGERPREMRPDARPADNRVQPMTIYNGARRTVAYFGSGLSDKDRTTLADLQRAENARAGLDGLMSLQQQYIADERALQALRVQ